MAETRRVREYIETVEYERMVYYPPQDAYLKPPYCPPYEGDFIYSILAQNKCAECLQIGFASGSTALYILESVKLRKGNLVSIDIPGGYYNDIGQENLAKFGADGGHQLILDDSAVVLPQMLKDGVKLDFVYADGWKTFDHLAMELFYLTRMLRKGGFIVFDDAKMPSVRKLITMLVRYYDYREVEYSNYRQTKWSRIYHTLTTRSIRRNHRAFKKVKEQTDLPVTQEWNFFVKF